MKKKWKEPKLELLNIKETMASWKGNTNDWTFIGREYEEVEPDPDPGNIGS
ncbi:paeninodin family lasso peptide [Oceanobacillus halophilus]|uniref:Paeninodin family lasso peptide n=1 Tax=Oceanobacillus halophilus TaxID=930130 RepID=A0A495A1X6_9BACI|nr:paeninodin family lasso peptide [Oceanobacillus halophilus]RKQ33472.1 paeninodin family lasso peptide [Oceanobacillus halophilus]